MRRALITAAVAAGMGAVLVAAPAFANPNTVNPTPFSTSSEDGRAYDVTVVGGTAYVGGAFSSVTSGGTTYTRNNVAAYTMSTGAIVPGFVANTDGLVYAVISDGSFLYLGGDFTHVNGTAAARVAKVSLATGQVQTFHANANTSVRGLAVDNGRLYLAGFFKKVNGQTRSFGAAVSTSLGDLDTGFMGTANLQPNSKAYSVEVGPGGTLYMGGTFTNVGGAARSKLAQLDPTTGAAMGPTSFKGLNGRVLDISLSPDGTHVLGAADDGQNTCFSWTASTGAKNWGVKLDGNCQDVVWLNNNVYFGFHDGYQGANNLRLMTADATTGVVEPGFMPITAGLKGVLGVATDGTRLIAVGDFPKMNGKNVKGVAFFS